LTAVLMASRRMLGLFNVPISHHPHLITRNRRSSSGHPSYIYPTAEWS
jgi:hypothetical protein